MPLSILQSRHRHRPYWPLATGWANRVWKSISNLNDFTNDTNTMKTYLKTYGSVGGRLCRPNDLYTSVADLKANYRGPVSGDDHEVSLVGYYDDASVPYRRILDHQE